MVGLDSASEQVGEVPPSVAERLTLVRAASGGAFGEEEEEGEEVGA